MSFLVPYMGTKRSLAPIVADAICRARDGIVLDAFSGMCAIGQAIGTRRTVWNNDAQKFASKVAEALFAARRPLNLSHASLKGLTSHYSKNLRALEKRFQHRLKAEANCLSRRTVASTRDYLATAEYVGNSMSLEKERVGLSARPATFPYRLCSITFSDAFFGLRQSLEIDSARYALDTSLARGLISQDEFNWLLIALCNAAVRVATTTGHFAQFLTVKSNNLGDYVAKRRRLFWADWMECAAGLAPIGRASWRKRNRVFNTDSISLLGILGAPRHLRPAVIYADPPYTDDQYSRYYHVWETLVQYDYPAAEGVGRYRPDRFQTPFSRIGDVEWAFCELILRSAELGADMVVSYPENGLLRTAGHDLLELLKRFYSKVSILKEISLQHSTMGASKGSATLAVVERVYFASNS